MRVLLVASHFAPAWIEGGQTFSSWNLMRGLALAGTEVQVVTTDAYLRPHERVATERIVEGLHIRTVPIVSGLGPRAHRQGLAPGIASAIGKSIRQTDLCLLQGLWTLPVLVAYAICMRRRVPHVLSARGTLEERSLSERARRKRLYMRLVAGGLIRRAAAVHFASEREWHNSRGALGSTPAIVAPQGFDAIERSAREGPRLRHELGLPADSVLLGYAGRLHPRKGLRELLPALAACPPRVHLVCFGSDLEGHGRELAARARALGLGSRYRHCGHLEGDGLRRAYASIDLLVLPSFGESFGNVVIEALLQGTAVMVSDQVALAEWVERNRLGRVVAGHDPESWTAAIRGWLEHPVEFERDRAAACVRRDFELTACGRRLQSALEPLGRRR